MINALTLMTYNPDNIKRAADKYFHKDELRVFSANNKKSFFEILSKEKIDLVIISNTDISNENIIDIVQNVRIRFEEIIIMVITGSESRSLAMKLYLLGIDEWIKRPIDALEVTLRIRAIFRRVGIQESRNLKVGDLIIDFNSHSVKFGDRIINLPKKEFLLLHLLLSHPDRVYSKTELMEQVWGFDSDSSDATVTVHIGRIRERFKGTDSFEIVSVRGVGYKATVRT